MTGKAGDGRTRVLFGLRLFSGLAESLATRTWRPSGVPAIYKLLEGAAARPDLRTLAVFAVKDRPTSQRFPRAERLDIPEIGPVLILPYRRLPFGGFRRLELLLTEVEHALRFLWLQIRFRPAASYFTAVNVPAAALFARLRPGRVYLRLLGVMPEHRRLVSGVGPLRRWLYRAPFTRVICTQEGSGAERVLPKLLAKRTPWDVVLNGVDPPTPPDDSVVGALRDQFDLDARPIVLFLGRLEDYKGCGDFVDAMIALLDANAGRAQALVVGGGGMQDELTTRVEAAGRDKDIRILGAVSHDRVSAFYAACDIYVSLNRHGNLSNANLEALASGCCMVLLASDPETGIDEATDRMIPSDIAPRVARRGTAAALTTTLDDLLGDPDRRARLRHAAARRAPEILGTWPDRVARELAMIAGDAPASARAADGAGQARG